MEKGQKKDCLFQYVVRVEELSYEERLGEEEERRKEKRMKEHPP